MVTCPASTRRSASRREQIPASLKYLLMRTPASFWLLSLIVVCLPTVNPIRFEGHSPGFPRLALGHIFPMSSRLPIVDLLYHVSPLFTSTKKGPPWEAVPASFSEYYAFLNASPVAFSAFSSYITAIAEKMNVSTRNPYDHFRYSDTLSR